MKRTIVAILVFAASGCFAQTIKTISNTEIKEVKIYLAGAAVVREVKTTVEAGTTQLAVEGLSQYINSSSITVTGTGDATLLSVVSQIDYVNTTRKSSKLKMLQDSLDDLNHANEKLNDLITIYNGEIEVLNANKSVGGANTGVDRDNLREYIEFYRERMIELKIKLMDSRNEQKK